MRFLATAILRLCCRLLPPDKRPWGRAAFGELSAIERPGEALSFALGCLAWATRYAVAARPSFLLNRKDHPVTSPHIISGPRAVALSSAAAATTLGMIYMAMGGAPSRYLMINAAAFAFGLTVLGILALADRRRHLPGRSLVLVSGAALLATALLGVRIDGISRWLALGPLTIQPSMMLLPLMMVLFARYRDALSLFGIALAALALALQPDRGMAGALVAGLAVLAFTRPNHNVLSALAVAVVGFAATVAQADPSPAMPFVDRIFYSSFSVHPLAGTVVLLGAALLIVPVFAVRGPGAPETAVFGAVWAALIVAAALGNYPTPIVGYGGSAVIGYLIALMSFPRRSGPVGSPEQGVAPARSSGDDCSPYLAAV